MRYFYSYSECIRNLYEKNVRKVHIYLHVEYDNKNDSKGESFNFLYVKSLYVKIIIDSMKKQR